MTPGTMWEIGTDYGIAWKNLFARRVHAAAFFAHIAMRPSTTAVCLQVLKKFPTMFDFWRTSQRQGAVSWELNEVLAESLI